jgi:hypothetical protein
MESSFDFEARVCLCRQWYVSTLTIALTRDVAQVVSYLTSSIGTKGRSSVLAVQISYRRHVPSAQIRILHSPLAGDLELWYGKVSCNW